MILAPPFQAAPEWRASEWFNTGQPPSLASLRGQVVVLHAFQMLCPACVSHGVPLAERVHRAHLPGVAVVCLHTVFEHHAAMTPVALQAFLHEYRITHPIGVAAYDAGDPVPATLRSYAMQGTPTLLLIDAAGRLRAHGFGQVEEWQLGVALGQLLAETRP